MNIRATEANAQARTVRTNPVSNRLRLHKPLTGRLPRRPRPVEDRMRFESLHETVDGNHRIPAAPFGALVEGYNTASGWQERDPPALETAKPSPLNRNDGFA